MAAVGRLRLIGGTPPSRGQCTPAATPDHWAAWEGASEAEQDQARSRLAAVRLSDDLVAAGLARAVADRRAAGEAGVSLSTVAAWRRRVRGLPEEVWVAALVDGVRTGRPSAIDGNLDWREEAEALAFERAMHLTATEVEETLIARHGAAPHIRSIQRWLSRWRADHAAELSAVANPDRHRSHRQPAFGEAGAVASGLNALWELDSTMADVICADGRRRALVAAIDVWSRRSRFLIAPTSRATAIAALLRLCILEWGVPAAVRTDEGADYTSRHVLAVFDNLGIEHLKCRPYRPEEKPFVERLIGTVSRGLFARLPGFAGHSPADAAALRSRKSFAGRRGEAPPVTLGASLDADELQARLDTWADAHYGRKPHSGLDGETPFARANSWTGPVHRIQDARALDALLAVPAGGDGRRVVRKTGIMVDGGEYIAAELGPLVKQRVQVLQDPADLGRIHVYRETADGKRGAFVCVAEDPARTGIDRAAVAAQAKALARRADNEARSRAADLKRRRKPETAIDDVLAHSAAEAERVVALPRRSEDHETPALAEAARAAKAADEADAPAAPSRRSARQRIAAANRRYLEEA